MPAGLSKPVAATGEDGRHLYTCPLCGHVRPGDYRLRGEVAGIRGNRDHTWSRRHLWASR